MVALFNAFGMMLDFTARQIRPGQIDGFQKVLNRAVIFNLKLVSHPLDGKLQVPDHIPVFFQQFPGIMVQRVFRCCRVWTVPDISRNVLLSRGYNLLPCRRLIKEITYIWLWDTGSRKLPVNPIFLPVSQ